MFGIFRTPSRTPMPYPIYGLTWDHISMPMSCPRHGLTLALISSRCHVPDMVLHWLSYVRADAMSQTWSYTSTPRSVPMPCPRHGLTLAHSLPWSNHGLFHQFIMSCSTNVLDPAFLTIDPSI
ncbi:hypothetical protein V6Z11_D09G212800 [Gossypium hirsutum]